MKIPTPSGFTLCPAGEHVFKITSTKYDENFGILEIHMETKDGMNFLKRFGLKDGNDEFVQGALNAWAFFAKTVLNRWDMEECDPAELVGKYVKIEIVHKQIESKRKPGTMITVADTGDMSHATAFEGEELSLADMAGLLDE